MKAQIYCLSVLLIVSLTIPFILPVFYVTLLFLFFIYCTLAEMFNLVSEYAGLLFLGLHGFFGFGGYITAIFVGLWHFNAGLGVLMSGTVCLVLALIASFLILRMRGVYFAIGTLTMASALFYWIQGWSYVGGGFGMSLYSGLSIMHFYYISLLLSILSIIVSWIILKGTLGLRLKAIADSDLIAESYGINVFQTKLIVWNISSFVTGLAGGVYFAYSGFITPTAAFDFRWTLAAITATVIGGRRTIEGPAIGALIAIILRQYLFTLFPGFTPLIYGLLLLVVLWFMPGGIIKTIKLRNQKSSRKGRSK